jgi:hypothetical protein
MRINQQMMTFEESRLSKNNVRNAVEKTFFLTITFTADNQFAFIHKV